MGLSAMGQGVSCSPEPTILSASLPALLTPQADLQQGNTRRIWIMDGSWQTESSFSDTLFLSWGHSTVEQGLGDSRHGIETLFCHLILGGLKLIIWLI